MLEEIQMDEELTNEPDKVVKKWKAKIENKSLDVSDIVSYFQHSAPYFLSISRKDVASEIGESPEIYCLRKNHNGANKEREFHSFSLSISQLWLYSLKISLSFTIVGNIRVTKINLIIQLVLFCNLILGPNSSVL